jgi:hypothetical protein
MEEEKRRQTQTKNAQDAAKEASLSRDATLTQPLQRKETEDRNEVTGNSIEAEEEIPNRYDYMNPFLQRKTLRKLQLEVRDETSDLKRIFRWRTPPTEPKIITIPKKGEREWITTYDDGIIKIKLSLRDFRYYQYIHDEFVRIVDFGYAWDLGTKCMEIAQAFYTTVKQVRRKGGKAYHYDVYIKRPKRSALKAFKEVMARRLAGKDDFTYKFAGKSCTKSPSLSLTRIRDSIEEPTPSHHQPPDPPPGSSFEE